MFGFGKTFTLKDIPDLKGKRYIITGGTSGLGLSSAIALYEKNANVIITARNESRGQEAFNIITSKIPNSQGCLSYQVMNQTDLYSVKKFAEWVLTQNLPVDGILLNAGISLVPSELVQGVETHMLVNHLSHFYLMELLFPYFIEYAPFRVVYVSSGAYEAIQEKEINWDKVFTQSYSDLKQVFLQYGYSKIANIYHSNYLATLASDKEYVYVNAIHPGMVSTNIFTNAPLSTSFWGRIIFFIIRNVFAYDADKGALTQLYALTHSDIQEKKIKGKYFV